MRRHNQSAMLSSPSLDLIAKRIGDPVIRLRFLKYVAPQVPGRPRRRVLWAIAVISICISTVLALVSLGRSGGKATPTPAVRVQPTPPALPSERRAAEIGLLQDESGVEIYTNGLRIDGRSVVPSHHRFYLVFPADGRGVHGALDSSKPAGIVFHTTESRHPMIEDPEDRSTRRREESLVDYVRRRRAYHFLIDRLGVVHRIVAESDAANHAGYSVWADETSVYINLNESFLGVSFEADTQPGQVQPAITEAQIHAAALLTSMLRARYAIPAANCVTHAQVSVNPTNMRVGYHTDWASSFPYDALELPNNYARASAAIAMFGFEYDPNFLHWAGTQLYAGIESGDRQLRDHARRAGVTAAAYRKSLQKRYQDALAMARASAPPG